MTLILTQKPYKLLLITTGNITNNQLENLLSKNLHQLTELFTKYRFLEINKESLIVHF